MNPTIMLKILLELPKFGVLGLAFLTVYLYYTHLKQQNRPATKSAGNKAHWLPFIFPIFILILMTAVDWGTQWWKVKLADDAGRSDGARTCRDGLAGIVLRGGSIEVSEISTELQSCIGVMELLDWK